jgi:hypothetical protein
MPTTNQNPWAKTKEAIKKGVSKVEVKIVREKVHLQTNAVVAVAPKPLPPPEPPKKLWTTDEIAFIWIVIFAIAAFSTIGVSQYRKRYAPTRLRR